MEKNHSMMYYSNKVIPHYRMDFNMRPSTLTSKGQTTIPAEVRKALDLHPGDLVRFEIKNHQAIISKIEPFDHEYHRALSSTLSEWDSPNDEEAYGDL